MRSLLAAWKGRALSSYAQAGLVKNGSLQAVAGPLLPGRRADGGGPVAPGFNGSNY